MRAAHVSKTRVVSYTFKGDFNEPAVEKLLTRALNDGVVTQFDTGRGRLVWFNGPPGEKLRMIRTKVLELVKRGNVR